MKLLIIALYVVTLPWNELFLEEMSLGDDVVWAAMDISGLDINYKDGTRAGIWGLTPAVARNYGLRVDRWVDERYDVKRSSVAAAYYMKDLISRYDNDTARALMAFVNTPFRQVGDERWVTPGRAARQISRDVLQKLRDQYNITDEERARRIAETDSVRAESERQQQIMIAERQEVQNQVQQPSEQPQQQQQKTTIHKVKQGDTLSQLARKYRCTVAQLKLWNGLKSDLIRIGQKLKIKK